MTQLEILDHAITGIAQKWCAAYDRLRADPENIELKRDFNDIEIRFLEIRRLKIHEEINAE